MWEVLRGRSGSVENLDEHKNHDVVGEDEQAEVAALTMIGATADVTALADPWGDRFCTNGQQYRRERTTDALQSSMYSWVVDAAGDGTPPNPSQKL